MAEKDEALHAKLIKKLNANNLQDAADSCGSVLGLLDKWYEGVQLQEAQLKEAKALLEVAKLELLKVQVILKALGV